METKQDSEKSAKENWQLAREWDRLGDSARADEARRRAIKDEKARDSWLYRTFGW